MDFDKALMHSQGYGNYESIQVDPLPNFYIAYRAELSEGTEVSHNILRVKYDEGNPDALNAMTYWADLTRQAKTALEENDQATLFELINQNFDCRADLYEKLGIRISQGNLEMVRAGPVRGRGERQIFRVRRRHRGNPYQRRCV